MKGFRAVMRVLGGAAVTAALSACSDSPLAPANDLALNTVSEGVTVTQFTATDVFTGLAEPGLTEVRGAHFVIRGVVVTSRITGTDPRLTGNARITINGQLLMTDGSGPLWGTLEDQADVGGVWKGRGPVSVNRPALGFG